MFLLTANVTKTLLAQLTRVRFFSSVGPHVLLEVAGHTERPATALVTTLVRLVSRVYPVVPLQVSLVSEGTAAHLANVGSLPGMCPLVGLQVIALVECPLTTLKGTDVAASRGLLGWLGVESGPFRGRR